MANINLDLSEVAEKSEEIAAQQEAEAAPVCTCDDEMTTGHKVVFGIVIGILCLSGVGIPVMIWLLIKSHNKNKDLQKQLDELSNKPQATPETAATETTEAKPKEEEKAPETK